MRAADDRVKAINHELHKRPTATGVRYRLLWEPLSVEEGAPANLDTARKSLLNTSADLWSIEDRRAVGTMLQQQIAAERALADADSSGRSLGRDPARAQQLLVATDIVLRRLPEEGLPRSQLAAETLGDAHALDTGRPVATLVLSAWRLHERTGDYQEDETAAETGGGTDERVREVWSKRPANSPSELQL